MNCKEFGCERKTANPDVDQCMGCWWKTAESQGFHMGTEASHDEIVRLQARVESLESALNIHREAIGCLIRGTWQDAAIELQKLAAPFTRPAGGSDGT